MQTAKYEAELLSSQSEIKLIDLQLSEWVATLKDHGDNTDAWSKILVAIESRRRLTESEGKYLELNGRTLTKADARAFMDELSKIIKKAVNDHVAGDVGRQILTDISEGIIRLGVLIEAHESPH